MSHSAQPSSASVEATDPFELVITARDAPTTLLEIALNHAHIPLAELRLLNRELDELSADAVLPPGTHIHLPVRTARRGGGEAGLPFVLAEAEARLRRCEDALDALVAEQTQQNNNNTSSATAATAGTSDETSTAPPSLTTDNNTMYELPARRVYSKTEQIVAAMHAEAARQLPHIEAAIRADHHRERHLHFLVDVDAMKAREADVDATFASATASLQSYQPQYMSVMSQPPPPSSLLSENVLTPASLQTVTDTSEDYCVEHTHRWEFVFCGPSSLEPQDAWAVLACQPLTVLLDAFECTNNVAPFVPQGAPRNAFLFIHGVFYVDDRAEGAVGYEDLSAAIRHFDPALATRAACAPAAMSNSSPSLPLPYDGAHDESSNREIMDEANAPHRNVSFGECPVRSAAKTTFGELSLKMGELNVLRHLGQCTHYFYLHGARSLRGCTRTERDAFPHRVMKRKDRALHCHMCRQFPATIALYGDALAAHEPAMYCAVCYELLHGADSPGAAAEYLKVEPEHLGDYFKC